MTAPAIGILFPALLVALAIVAAALLVLGTDANRTTLRYRRKEVSTGDVIGGPYDFQNLPFRSEGLAQTTQSTTSQEIRADRQTPDVIRTAVNVDGPIGFEFKRGAFDDLIEAALQSVAWTNAAARASQVLTLDTNPTDGDTMTVGSTVYRFKSTMAQANDIKLEASLAATKPHIVATINGDGVAGTDFYTGTVVHPDVYADPDGFSGDALTIYAKATGTAGNSIATTETFTAGTNVFAGATLAGGTAGGVTAITNTNISFAASDEIRSATTGAFASVTVGSFVKVSGAATSGNNGYARVTAVGDWDAGGGEVNNALTVAGHTITTEAAGASVTLKFSEYVTNGTRQQAFDFEKEFTSLSGAGQFARYADCQVNSLQLDFAAEDIITGSFGVMGGTEESASATQSKDTTDAPDVPTMATVTGVPLVVDGTDYTAALEVVSAGVAIANNLRKRPLIGQLAPDGFGSGSFECSGTLQLYYEDATLIDKFLNWTTSGLLFVLRDSEGGEYLIELPAIKYTAGPRSAGAINTDIYADLQWTAFRDETRTFTCRVHRIAA